MRRTAQAATSRHQKMKGSQTNKSYTIGIQLRNPSAFERDRTNLNVAASASIANQNSNPFVETNNFNTNSLLIADHGPEQPRTEEVSAFPMSPHVNQQGNLVSPANGGAGPFMLPTQDVIRSSNEDELDLNSRLHMQFTNVANSPGASQSLREAGTNSGGHFSKYRSIFKHRVPVDQAQKSGFTSTRLRKPTRDLNDKQTSMNSTTLSNNAENR